VSHHNFLCQLFFMYTNVECFDPSGYNKCGPSTYCHFRYVLIYRRGKWRRKENIVSFYVYLSILSLYIRVKWISPQKCIYRIVFFLYLCHTQKMFPTKGNWTHKSLPLDHKRTLNDSRRWRGLGSVRPIATMCTWLRKKLRNISFFENMTSLEIMA